MSDHRIIVGDVLAGLGQLPDRSVQCCVTSPPYWGLRDYGTARWDGGDPACDHRSPTMREGRNESRATLGGGIMATNAEQLRLESRTGCGKCGARRVDHQIGLEATPDDYVERMVAVFREVWRVLRDDGTLWLNLGDSYAGGGGFSPTAPSTATSKSGKYGSAGASMKSPGHVEGLKAKDLVGIPWRVAFALQADGWWLRSDVIWSKPNPMPESITDRPTKSHEYLFLLTKAERYYYDAEAVREVSAGAWNPAVAFSQSPASKNASRPDDQRRYGFGTAHDDVEKSGRNRRTVWRVPWGIEDAEALLELMNADVGRGDLWEIATQPFKEAHFATYPEDLVRPCVEAGTSEVGCCPVCACPVWRVVETETVREKNARLGFSQEGDAKTEARRGAGIQAFSCGNSGGGECSPTVATMGWRPTCGHYPRTGDWAEIPSRMKDETDEAYGARLRPLFVLRGELLDLWAPLLEDCVPCRVLDPFSGSGTTGAVSVKLGRRYVGVELNPEYAAMSERRIGRAARPGTYRDARAIDAPLFANGEGPA